MDDEEHARELFAILTRPVDPDGPVDAYGTGPDGIDRHGGFGTEVRVRSIDVVPGEHGTQMEVGFAMDVPADLNVPAEGSILLPVAAEWREAQGCEQPSAHAPVVARAVLHGAGRHVDAHSGTTPREDAPVADRETQHALLHDVLRQESAFGEGSFEEVAPGRFVVRRSPAHQTWTILVTPDQWEQVVGRHGRRTWLLEHFSELLASGHRDDRFLVFWEGDLVRSTREELPPVNGSLRALLALQASRPRHLGPEDGWYAYRPDTSDEELPGMESNHRR